MIDVAESAIQGVEKCTLFELRIRSVFLSSGKAESAFNGTNTRKTSTGSDGVIESGDFEGSLNCSRDCCKNFVSNSKPTTLLESGPPGLSMQRQVPLAEAMSDTTCCHVCCRVDVPDHSAATSMAQAQRPCCMRIAIESPIKTSRHQTRPPASQRVTVHVISRMTI